MPEPTTMLARAQTLLAFLKTSERLKLELRHSWLSNGRQESVAEHSWQMALMAVLLHPELTVPVDLGHTLELILVHDLVEAEAGDVPFFEQSERKATKHQRELQAARNMRAALGPPVGERIHDLWQEFEAGVTAEAKFAIALDHLEVQVQHNLADLDSWTEHEYRLVYTKMDQPCAIDPFLAAFCAAVKAQAEGKMQAGGIDLTSVHAALAGAPQERPG
jgi:putative hydrolase of HD superfamily